jgi:hypothetical protein
MSSHRAVASKHTSVGLAVAISEHPRGFPANLSTTLEGFETLGTTKERERVRESMRPELVVSLAVDARDSQLHHQASKCC